MLKREKVARKVYKLPYFCSIFSVKSSGYTDYAIDSSHSFKVRWRQNLNAPPKLRLTRLKPRPVFLWSKVDPQARNQVPMAGQLNYNCAIGSKDHSQPKHVHKPSFAD